MPEDIDDLSLDELDAFDAIVAGNFRLQGREAYLAIVEEIRDSLAPAPRPYNWEDE